MSRFDKLIEQLGKLDTEQTNPDTIDIDRLGSLEIVSKINREDTKVASVVGKSLEPISKAAEMYAQTLSSGGRVFYIGAGTSGRLGVLDAAECPPTFGTDPGEIVGLISGGYDTLVHSKEGVEDRTDEAVEDLKRHQLSKRDFVIGIAASGRTPYTLSGLEYAVSVGAHTAYILCNAIEQFFHSDKLCDMIDLIIPLPVGPEVITGSTRMKSGTAQKMVLNMISTTAMVLMGKTFGNLMIDLQARSDKLSARSRKILIDLFEITADEAGQLLSDAGGSVKLAIVIKRFGSDQRGAKALLERAGGFINRIKNRE